MDNIAGSPWRAAVLLDTQSVWKLGAHQIVQHACNSWCLMSVGYSGSSSGMVCYRQEAQQIPGPVLQQGNDF